MGDNKISEVAVAVYGIRVKGNHAIVGVLPVSLKYFPVKNPEWDQRYEEVPLYLHPQPAELSDVFSEALAVGDGTPNSAAVYWHQRALAAEAKLSEVGGEQGDEHQSSAQFALDALVAVGHVEQQKVDQALAIGESVVASGKQPGSERERFEAWAEDNGFALSKDGRSEYQTEDTHLAWTAWQAALASRQPVGLAKVRDDAICDGVISALTTLQCLGMGRGCSYHTEIVNSHGRDRLTERAMATDSAVAAGLIDGRDAGAGVDRG